MASFPGTQVSGNGTTLLLPDNATLSWGSVLGYKRSAATITFQLATGLTQDYVAGSDLYAQKVMAALRSIPLNPASFYVVALLIPSFCVLVITPVTDVAAGGTPITVTGIGFVSGCRANLGGKAATVVFTNSTTLTVTTPAGTAGDSSNLIIINPDGSQAVGPDSFIWT